MKRFPSSPYLIRWARHHFISFRFRYQALQHIRLSTPVLRGNHPNIKPLQRLRTPSPGPKPVCSAPSGNAFPFQRLHLQILEAPSWAVFNWCPQLTQSLAISSPNSTSSFRRTHGIREDDLNLLFSTTPTHFSVPLECLALSAPNVLSIMCHSSRSIILNQGDIILHHI